MVKPAAYHLKIDTAEVRRKLRDVPARAMPYAAATGLTWTAQNIRDAEVATMQSVFDRPTRFTLNALQVKPANAQTLTASVEFKSGFGSVPAWRYLQAEVEGGPRHKKAHELALERAGILRSDEFVMPGAGATLDAAGNMRGSEISRILSQIKASGDPLQNATGSARSRRSRKRLAYFVSRGRKGIADGIYLRRGTERGIVPVMVFAKRPRYQPRFPFYDVARQVFGVTFVSNVRAAWQRMAARLEAKR